MPGHWRQRRCAVTNDALLATVGVEELQGRRNRFLICGHQATERAHSDAPAAAATDWR